jgi:hypothetical protein
MTGSGSSGNRIESDLEDSGSIIYEQEYLLSMVSLFTTGYGRLFGKRPIPTKIPVQCRFVTKRDTY